jgi:hypothetical protein
MAAWDDDGRRELEEARRPVPVSTAIAVVLGLWLAIALIAFRVWLLVT